MMSKDILDLMMQGLTSNDPARIIAGLSELPEFIKDHGGHPDLVAPLTSLLNDDDVDIRRLATWGLGRLALAKVGDPSSIADLNLILADADPETRENATWALGEMAGFGIGHRSSIPGLNALLSDGSAEVRGMAAWAIGRMAERMGSKDEESVILLKRLAEDESQNVRKAASLALRALQDP